jgi:hypothetical protein
MSNDNTNGPNHNHIRELSRRRAAEASGNVRLLLESGHVEAAIRQSWHVWMHNEIANAENPAECGDRIEDLVQGRNPDRPQRRLVVDNTVLCRRTIGTTAPPSGGVFVWPLCP